ncbi:E3 ubiquitin-protein ligase TRIM7-like [Mauremys reevesii]|uniref:E3 ubiquitin-protein ligase TRIM7-like n=1 Tax=Mauremys reevesii TaxID=260615 RepID=UPI00193F4129|nr:E3 ubiquitin-protein ligase TRIM7-like [Mauremys reevesii]XP_039374813.1 E3 ubiquitin-protein ligase TRIM7-like [Mauremys reevesii]XP_039374814.1 E3 ubiquitin-protein ligase TRIM7-like [Mauremys reevesii]
MAAANPAQQLLGELKCAVCRDYFKDPVSLDCGHHFCQGCITQCWEGLSTDFHCPECRETFSRRNLKPNRQLRNIVEASRKLTLEPAKEPEVGTVCEKHQRALDVFCQKDQTPICVVCHLSRDHKGHPVVLIEEAAEDYKKQIRSRLEILKKEREEILTFKLSGENKSHELLKQLETEKQKIVSEFQQLHQFLEEQERLLLAQLEELKKEIEKTGTKYVAKLSEELSSFSSLIGEMEQNCQQPASEFLQDIKGTLSRYEREKFQNPVAFSSELKWRIGKSSQNSAVLETIVKKFKDSLSSRQRLDKANVTLDPDTASPYLILSADRKSVRWVDTWQVLPDNPERFDTWTCVLGCEGFTSGRHYWEVEVEEEGGVWAVGVARESVNRKGWIRFTPERGIWAVLCSEDQYWALTSPEQSIPFPPSSAPRKIRVYLDYEQGQVAFFDAGTGDPIVTFPPASFAGERIRPIFLVVDCSGVGVSVRLL